MCTYIYIYICIYTPLSLSLYRRLPKGLVEGEVVVVHEHAHHVRVHARVVDLGFAVAVPIANREGGMGDLKEVTFQSPKFHLQVTYKATSFFDSPFGIPRWGGRRHLDRILGISGNATGSCMYGQSRY